MSDWLRKSLGRKSQSVLPFSQRDLEVMVGKDFYVMVSSRNAEDMMKSLSTKRPVTDFPKGSLCEVISNPKSGAMEVYFLSNLRAATYEDGTLVRDGIVDRVYQDFIFTLSEVRYGADSLPILEGMSLPYSHRQREIPSSPRKMIVEFASLPQSKKYGKIVSFSDRKI